MRHTERRALIALAGAGVLLLGVGERGTGNGARQTTGVTAFVGVNVIPMDRERVLENQTVVVRDGLIAALGPAASTPVPAGAVRVEARGKYLMPGLAEMHGHVPSPGQEQQWGRGYTERVLFLYVAAGVTTVRSMLGDPSHPPLRERAESGEIIAPRLWLSGPSANNVRTPTPARADSMVRAQKAFGYDFIKIHPGVPRDAFDALDRAADEIGMKYAGHVPVAVGVPRALEAGYWSIDHLDGYLNTLVRDGAPVDRDSSGFFGIVFVHHVDPAKIATIARATREAGVWNVPTQTLMEQLATDLDPEVQAHRPELKYMPRDMVANWVNQKRNFLAQHPADARHRFIEVRRQLVKALHDAGAGLLLGSDAPQWWNVPGFSALRELELIVAAGLTPFQAIETGTGNVALYFGIAGQQGTIAVGRRADLVLLDANPLADISNVWKQSGVMIRGRWIPRAEIVGRLAEIAAAYATP